MAAPLRRFNDRRSADFRPPPRAGAIALAERLGADRLELANAQYLGWALANRDALLPTRGQIDAARAVAAEARARLEGKMDVLFVVPDYHSKHPRACMDGWGRRFLHMTPNGTLLPCHAARSIRGLSHATVREHSLAPRRYLVRSSRGA